MVPIGNNYRAEQSRAEQSRAEQSRDVKSTKEKGSSTLKITVSAAVHILFFRVLPMK